MTIDLNILGLYQRNDSSSDTIILVMNKGGSGYEGYCVRDDGKTDNMRFSTSWISSFTVPAVGITEGVKKNVRQVADVVDKQYRHKILSLIGEGNPAKVNVSGNMIELHSDDNLLFDIRDVKRILMCQDDIVVITFNDDFVHNVYLNNKNKKILKEAYSNSKTRIKKGYNIK